MLHSVQNIVYTTSQLCLWLEVGTHITTFRKTKSDTCCYRVMIKKKKDNMLHRKCENVLIWGEKPFANVERLTSSKTTALSEHTHGTL